jgi:hypothetical protein
LKENSNIITEAKECVLMPNHTHSLEQIDKKLQQHSHVFDDPVTCYVVLALGYGSNRRLREKRRNVNYAEDTVTDIGSK